MSGQKDLKATEWLKTPAGRPYRRLEIEGVRYTQWDHSKGPVLADNPPSSTPRTVDPRNLSRTQSSPTQRASETRPTSVRHAQPTPSISNLPPSRSYSRDPYPPENHQHAYSLFPREDRGESNVPDPLASISQQRASAPSSGGIYNEPDSLPNRVNPSRHAVAESLPRNVVNPRETGQPEPYQTEYPQGVNRGGGIRDRTRYYERDGNSIRVEAAIRHGSREETRADHGPSVDNLTAQFSSMGAQRGFLEENEQPRTPRHSSNNAPSTQAMPDDDYSHGPQTINDDRRLSTTYVPGLPTISESGLPKTTRIAGDNKRPQEVMDSRYQVRKDARNFFKEGRVFAMLWHENAGTEGTEITEGFSKGKYGQYVYSTIRRMVVVIAKDGHCICVPIATYGSQATLKKGLSKAEIEAHAVIHMVGTSSEAAPGEKIVKNPITVKPATEDQKLHPKSRINFDKIYTIEHNVRVMNVGKVVAESMHNLLLYFKNSHFG